ncbi:hypothetical protein AAEU32_05430 [Pseudoalteromonas sp. SSDWG2]|uniref:hypothetical protein n=1 Tax=Pseudoalteromonas sp. SSDWG2 TaxID=3139391 RepID=UPI003BAD6AF8
MKRSVIAATVLCTLAAATYFTHANKAIADTSAALSPVLPKDIPNPKKVSLDALQHSFDVFSWQSFIALNWPATADGNPDTSKQIGQVGDMVVWQHYKESRDIFLPQGKTPPAWGQANPPPRECQAPDGAIVLNQVGKTPNVLDESGEPFQTGPLIDQNGLYTRFEILTNKTMFDYIVSNQLYSQEGQAKFATDANFPMTNQSLNKDGAIMIKAAWKVMGEGDDSSNFYTTDAYVYDNPHENAGVKAHCALQKVGLVGFHIGTKVENTPQWVWSTFEHINNVPTQGQPLTKTHYNYYNPKCTDCTVNTPPPRPWNPSNTDTPPSQVMRVIPIDDATKALNAQFHDSLQAAVPNSVWLNYELVSTQWPTNAQSTTDPTGAPAPKFLANTTLETYIQGEVKQTSSSCINCHNNATMTTGEFSDFTYLLQRAQAKGESNE